MNFVLNSSVNGVILRKFAVLSSCLLVLFTLVMPAHAATSLTATTDRGEIQGALRNGVIEFRGIPYAQSTAGAARWTLPKPVEPWSGVRDATQFGPACPQVARFNLTEGSDKEDCLSVNVSVPDNAETKRPVLVWIHGGAFVGGASSLYRLDALAQSGVVVVSMNYRLGALGFLAHPSFASEAGGAYGIADQREAMRWVQRNIAAFGGDPNNVTLAGESAGAGSICMHLANPALSTGLFNKAIVMSGGCLFPLPTLNQAASLANRLAKTAGCEKASDTLTCLRQTPLATLLQAQTDVSGTEVVAFGPAGGSSVAPKLPGETITSGEFQKVPVLYGGTQDELQLYVGYDMQAGKSVTQENYSAWLTALYANTTQEKDRKTVEAIQKAYPLDGSQPNPVVLGAVMSDYNPVVGINNCLFLKTANALAKYVPVYQFEFADRDALVLGVGMPAKPDPGFKLGAVHSSELNYLFPHLSNTSKIDAPDLPSASQELAVQMTALWTSFARSGKPQAKGIPEWPLYAGGATVMRFEPGKTALYDAGAKHKCAFWKSLYPENLN